MPEDFFDFEEHIEEAEEQNFNKFKKCGHCRKNIPEDAFMCFYCGERADADRKPAWIIITAILVMAAFLALFLIR